MSARLLAAARRVLHLALDAHRDDPARTRWLRGQLDRLDEPLRVAVAGKVKAGKSTLVNALVGERVAPTDAGECTKVVTWYRDGRVPRVVMQPKDGPLAPLPVDRRDGALVIDLAGMPVERLERLVVDWPAQALRATTLIDTPGVFSTSEATGRRTLAFLDPEDDRPTEADAVIYLMRHLHATDAAFLESFRDRAVARATSVNTVAVISRADEIAGGRVDAMFSARHIAQRYRGEPTMRALCQNVVAVSGLIAETGRTLRQSEFAALAELAREPKEALEAELLTVARFLKGGDRVVREGLLARFGIFGIRLSTSLLRQGSNSAAALAGELIARSGLAELERVLHTQFAERRDLLKARSALLAVDAVLSPAHRAGPLGRELERILAGAHEFVELRQLAALRSGSVGLPKPVAAEAERLLGDAGTAVPARLGLPPDIPPQEIRRAAFAALERWQRHAENPMFTRAATDACRVVVRTCEAMLVGMEQAAPLRAGPR
jgi:hypothetical protein